MNVYDSEQIVRGLRPLRYEMASSVETADLIIVNTCTIREKARQKAFSFLGRLADLKRKKPGLIIGVGGCVAQQEGGRILERMPFVDLVFGTRAVGRLPRIIERIESKRYRIVDVEMSGGPEEPKELAESLLGAAVQPAWALHLSAPTAPAGQAGAQAGADRDGEKVTSFVTIMQGCDNYCAYCVVPYVRGRETSRPPEKIIKEIRVLVESGAREVTLLGQNVNSYSKKEGLCSFPDLLSLVNEIDGLLRIRFTTSHPQDLSEDLIFSFRNLEKLCKHIHLPVQSGSSRILERMNRKYSRELYLEKVEKLRRACPDIAITSDIIVGFPGETETDFEETLDLVKRVEYDSLFAFKYSDRPNAPAAGLPDKVSERRKTDRLQKLLDFQQHFTIKKNQALVGSTELVLVAGLSKRQSRTGRQKIHQAVQWRGRTSTNKIVNFIQGDDFGGGNGNDNDIDPGRLVNVRIEEAFAHSLRGKLVSVARNRSWGPGIGDHC